MRADVSTLRGGNRGTLGLVFLSSLMLYGLTAGGSLTSSDAIVTYELARSLVERGSVALDGNVIGNAGNRGLDGGYYSQFGIGQSLYDIPFYLAGRAALRLGRSDDRQARHRPESGKGGGSTFAQQLSFSLDFWWAYLVYLRVLPRQVALAVASTLFVATACCAWIAWRSAGRGMAPATEVA